MFQTRGIQDLLGYGNATVDNNDWYTQAINRSNQQKQQDIENKRYEQRKKEQDDKELYDLVGDNLNLKDFNQATHDEVKKAQVELAKKFKAEKPSYGDAYILSQNKAADLTRKSQMYNHADQVIAANKKEFEGDKRLNIANIEAIARKDINQITR
jgi:hypothetical protein